MLWDLIVWLILGAIVGWIASMIVGRNKEMGGLANIVAGILGSVIGGFIVRYFFPDAPAVAGINLYSIVVGVIGAVLLLLVTGWFRPSS